MFAKPNITSRSKYRINCVKIFMIHEGL